jgi:hypothetical protein
MMRKKEEKTMRHKIERDRIALTWVTNCSFDSIPTLKKELHHP